MPTLDELHARGHDVAVRTLASEVGTMEARGFAAAPIEAAIERLPTNDWGARTRAGAAARAMRTFARRAGHQVEDLRRAIAQERPDALLIDAVAFGALAAAEQWGGPWACACAYPPPLARAGAPPAGLGLAPARGPAGRARDQVLGPFHRRALDRLMLPWLNGVRADCGLAPLARADELYLVPPLFLYMTAEPFEYSQPWPPNVVIVGPCSWEPPAELTAGLAAVEEPLVLITTSADLQEDGRLVATAFKALADGPFHLVATLPAAKPGAVRVPANATVLGFAAHGPILARAACAITHGGMGATQKALSHGVPVCAVPFGRDQFDVARRVELAGAGSRLPSWRLRPSALRRKVEEALTCGAGAKRVAAGFAAAGGGRAAADAVERLVLRGEIASAGDLLADEAVSLDEGEESASGS